MSADHIFANNPLCRLLGIRYPICQAGMYQVAYGPLAAAVSNAGGLGVIGSAYMPPARLREEIRIAKAETDKPPSQPITPSSITPTDVVVTVSDLIRAAGLNLWDLSMWFNRKKS